MKAFRKLMLPCGLSLIPVVKAESLIDGKSEKKLIRPSELPLYSSQTNIHDQIVNRAVDRPFSSLDNFFGIIRSNIQLFNKNLNDTTEKLNDKMKIGMEHSQVTLDFLRDEANLLPRIGAITFGTLTGYIFGLRGGKFKRLSYAIIAGSSVAAICYPKETKEHINNSTHYLNIVYNFAYGVKPGDKPLEIKWPEMDFTKLSSLSEMIGLSSKSDDKK